MAERRKGIEPDRSFQGLDGQPELGVRFFAGRELLQAEIVIGLSQEVRGGGLGKSDRLGPFEKPDFRGGILDAARGLGQPGAEIR